MKNLQVEAVDIGALKPWERNPRAHKEDIDALVKSIQTFGWTNPILVQRETNRVIAGHGRLEAAKRAGLTQVPVIYLDLDDKKATAYTIADNKLAENSEWDIPQLKELLVELDSGDFDLTATGYNEAELKALIDWERDTFAPVGIEEQSRLDQKKPIQCPECGHEFTT